MGKIHSRSRWDQRRACRPDRPPTQEGTLWSSDQRQPHHRPPTPSANVNQTLLQMVAVSAGVLLWHHRGWRYVAGKRHIFNVGMHAQAIWGRMWNDQHHCWCHWTDGVGILKPEVTKRRRQWPSTGLSIRWSATGNTSHDSIASSAVGHRDTRCNTHPDCAMSSFEYVSQEHHTRNWWSVNNRLQQINHWFPKNWVSQPYFCCHENAK